MKNLCHHPILVYTCSIPNLFFMPKSSQITFRLLKISAIFLGIILAGFISLLLLMTLLDYKPADLETIANFGNEKAPNIDKNEFSILTWNIGYAGLGKESDFFFDGGLGVRQTEEITKKNEQGILQFLQQNDSIDFFLLQEVDKNSRRTYYFDQSKYYSENFPDKSAYFAVNYDCAFVPQPIGNPYGKCLAGVMTMSNFSSIDNQRIALTPDASWPMGLFMLDRCLLESSFVLPNGKKLVIYNMHLSAYDDGTVKQEQMAKLKERILEQYENGNYVIVGGDWNQYPADYTVPVMKQKDAIAQIGVDKDFPSELWNWGVDVTVPSNRKLETPYDENLSDKIVIDFFLTSPNVEIKNVRGVDLNFEYSDHQPVIMNVRLK